MLTLTQAQALGYSLNLDTDLQTCHIVKDDEEVGRIHSACPLFFALRFVAELINDELATAEVTAALVTQLTGESYVEDLGPPIVLDPPVPASVVKDIVVAAITATVAVTSPNLTTQQVADIKAGAEAQVQAVIDQALGT